MKSLANKRVVVTGAGNGIGRELTLKLADHHSASVWAFDCDRSKLEELDRKLNEKGLHCHTTVGDATRGEDLQRLADIVTEGNQTIDIWVNNAGIQRMGPFNEQNAADFDDVINVDFNAVVKGTRIALRQMHEQGHGLIVNMASVAGHVPGPFMAAYTAAKHAVVGFTRAIQTELEIEDSAVRTLLVSPGFVHTEIIKGHKGFEFPQWLEWALAKPEDVAETIISAMQSGRTEIAPTLNGKFMMQFNRFFPQTSRRSSKVLLAKSLKDVFLNRYGN